MWIRWAWHDWVVTLSLNFQSTKFKETCPAIYINLCKFETIQFVSIYFQTLGRYFAFPMMIKCIKFSSIKSSWQTGDKKAGLWWIVETKLEVTRAYMRRKYYNFNFEKFSRTRIYKFFSRMSMSVRLIGLKVSTKFSEHWGTLFYRVCSPRKQRLPPPPPRAVPNARAYFAQWLFTTEILLPSRQYSHRQTMTTQSGLARLAPARAHD